MSRKKYVMHIMLFKNYRLLKYFLESVSHITTTKNITSYKNVKQINCYKHFWT